MLYLLEPGGVLLYWFSFLVRFVAIVIIGIVVVVVCCAFRSKWFANIQISYEMRFDGVSVFNYIDDSRFPPILYLCVCLFICFFFALVGIEFHQANLLEFSTKSFWFSVYINRINIGNILTRQDLSVDFQRYNPSIGRCIWFHIIICSEWLRLRMWA